MSARTKLNIAALNGTLLVAAIAGLAFQSWPVAWIVAGMLFIGDLYMGAIRLTGRSSRH